ncbi:hypothetical protein SADUNF_Sadunf04G0155800 [Salix dunnii]|uniref:Uncharacterized protein n=1 Tax=Salix dunnii TaxID=1413687 RepID=A0A835K5W9_9ROSI|nr:hypothetical protein SADUNF_Sadunf04G0155800 [Salix dunnii]
MRIPPKFAKHLVNLPGILLVNAGLLASKGIRTFCILKKVAIIGQSCSEYGISNKTSSQWDIEYNGFDFPDIADLYKELARK